VDDNHFTEPPDSIPQLEPVKANEAKSAELNQIQETKPLTKASEQQAAFLDSLSFPDAQPVAPVDKFPSP
jgi:hypothetical protein